MPRPKPAEPHRTISFQVRQSGDDWVRAEAKRRSIPMSALYRELMRLGMQHYKGQ